LSREYHQNGKQSFKRQIPEQHWLSVIDWHGLRKIPQVDPVDVGLVALTGVGAALGAALGVGASTGADTGVGFGAATGSDTGVGARTGVATGAGIGAVGLFPERLTVLMRIFGDPCES
jgi:hypothetical protein